MNNKLVIFFIGLLFINIVFAIPSILILSPTNTTYSTTDIDINWSTNETIANAWYSISGGYKIPLVKWQINSSIISGLSGSSSTTPNIFYKDGTWYLIDGYYLDTYNGWNWTGTSWQSDTAIISGLDGNIGIYPHLDVFEKDSTWYIIASDVNSNYFGFNWSGSTWQSDSAIVNGITSSDTRGAPSVFYKDGTWYFIRGATGGNFYGFNWTGTSWQGDSIIVNGLTDIGDDSTPSVFNFLDSWYLIAGEDTGDLHAFKWNETAWDTDSIMDNGLSDIGIDSAPSVFYKNSTLTLISGEAFGAFTGFEMLVIVNSTGIFTQGVNNINLSIITDSEISYSNITYLSIDSLYSQITINNPKNTTLNDNTPQIIATATDINSDSMWYSVDSGTNITDGWTTSINANITTLSDGNHNVTVYANDTYGNLNSTIRYFNIDTTSPVITLDSPTNTTYTVSNIDLNWSTDESYVNAIYSLNNNINVTLSEWVVDNEIINGLGDIGFHSTPSIFELNNTLYLISGDGTGRFNGFNWTGSAWQSDTLIISGIIDVGVVSAPTIFEKENTLYLIAGEHDGVFNGYNWTGTSWQSDTAIVSGLIDIGYDSAMSIFQKNNTWYLIAGNKNGIYGDFYGFNWTGSAWQSDTDIISGLTQINDRLRLTVFQKNTQWYLIAGYNSTNTIGYIWYNNTWNLDESIINGLNYTGESKAPTMFKKDNIIYLISGEYDGTFNGFILNDKNLTLNLQENDYNITLYVSDIVDNSQNITQYFSVNFAPTYSLNSTNDTHVGSEILHSLQWQDNTNLSGHIFSFDNGTGSFTNDTWVSMTGTLNWSNVTKKVNNTLATTIQWKVYVNDTYDYWNESETYYYTTTNEIPTQTPVTITPLPAETTDNLTCNSVYADGDNDSINNIWYRWYIDGILNVTTQNMSSTVTTLGDNIKCSVKVSDGYENSSWVNSSELTLGDTVAPVLHTQFLSTTTGAINTVFTVGINVTEANDLYFVKVEVTNPNDVKQNITMSLDTNGGVEHYYTRQYTPLIVGVYTFKFYAQDGSGYDATPYDGISNYAATVSDDGGGGGGGTTIITDDCGDGICSSTESALSCPQDCLLDYTIKPLETKISTYPSSHRAGRITITNVGLFDKTFTATVTPSDNFKISIAGEELSDTITFTLPKKLGLESGEKTIEWELDYTDMNVSVGEYNYTVAFNDGKNIVNHNVIVTVIDTPIFIIPPIYFMYGFFAILVVFALAPLLARR